MVKNYFVLDMVKNTKEFNKRVAHKVQGHIPIKFFVDYDPKVFDISHTQYWYFICYNYF